jgi:cytidylate kinase
MCGQRGAMTSFWRVAAASRAADSTRATAPLRPAEDAVVLDTTAMTADQALARAEALIRWKLGE